jgi:stalled ribosome rescue protein Dom34
MMKKFYEQITFDTGKLCYGPVETTKYLKDGAVEVLIVWDQLDMQYVKLKPKNQLQGTEEIVRYLRLKEIEY